MPTTLSCREAQRGFAIKLLDFGSTGSLLRLYRLFGRLAEAAGIPPSELTPHRLRRTYAVHFLDGVGGDLEKLRQHMGWASIATAAQYVDHSRREELDAVAEQVARRRGR
jgi:integrase